VADLHAQQPGYHPHRTIILDEQVESPETLTIRLEEEAARNGGDLTRGCPPGLLPMPMSAYKSQPPQLHGAFFVSGCVLAHMGCAHRC
jgi:hypothetical protein